MSKFAPITSDLLARKGDAGPLIVPAVKLPFVWSHDKTAAQTRAETGAPASGDSPPAPRPVADLRPGLRVPYDSGGRKGPEQKPRRISVLLSAREHETLGIVAVKRSLTRHRIVRDALDAHLEALAREYRTQCGCIATGCSCSGGRAAV